MNEITLNRVFKTSDKADLRDSMFEVILYDSYSMGNMEMWYVGLEHMEDLCDIYPGADWYFKDEAIHYRCSTYVVDKYIIDDMIGTKTIYTVREYFLDKLQSWIRAGLYYVSPKYEDSPNPELYAHKFTVCKVSGGTLKVYISFVGDNGWTSEVLYRMERYGVLPEIGDFYIGSPKKLNSPELYLEKEAEFSGSTMYLYKIIKSSVNVEPVYYPAGMPLPGSVINTLACEVDFARYAIDMLSSVKNLIGSTIGIERPTYPSSPSRSTKKDEDILRVTTGIGVPPADMKNYLLRRAMSIAKSLCDKHPDTPGSELLVIYRRVDESYINALADDNFSLYEMLAVDHVVECLLVQRGEKDLRAYLCCGDKLEQLKRHELLCSLHLLRYRVSALAGTMNKGIENRMHYMGGSYPYDAMVLMN